jgi:hypothetical protein
MLTLEHSTKNEMAKEVVDGGEGGGEAEAGVLEGRTVAEEGKGVSFYLACFVLRGGLGLEGRIVAEKGVSFAMT